VSRYELFKLLHVVGAIAWVGGGLGLLLLHRAMLRARDYGAMTTIARHSQALGARLFVPASLLTVGFGIAMVATESALGFTDLWILIGFAGIAASGVAESFVAAPAGKRLLALAEEDATEAELAVPARRVSLGSSLDVGLLLVVVWAMVAKPAW
jgi:uncharacterized membrane protein